MNVRHNNVERCRRGGGGGGGGERERERVVNAFIPPSLFMPSLNLASFLTEERVAGVSCC